MDMKYLFIIIFYYVGMGVIFSTFPAEIMDGSTQTGDYTDYNSTGYSEAEVGSGVVDILGTIVRFIAFAGIGYGIPDNSPSWLQLFVSVIAILMSSLVIFTIKNMIWTGGG